jgi:hypothetical protein
MPTKAFCGGQRCEERERVRRTRTQILQLSSLISEKVRDGRSRDRETNPHKQRPV